MIAENERNESGTRIQYHKQRESEMKREEHKIKGGKKGNFY